MNTIKTLRKAAAIGTTTVMSLAGIAVSTAIEIPLGVAAVVMKSTEGTIKYCKDDVPAFYAKMKKTFKVDEENDITEE